MPSVDGRRGKRFGENKGGNREMKKLLFAVTGFLMVLALSLPMAPVANADPGLAALWHLDGPSSHICRFVSHLVSICRRWGSQSMMR